MKLANYFANFLCLVAATSCAIAPANVATTPEALLLGELKSAQTHISVTRVYEEKMGSPISWRDIFEVSDLGNVAVAPDGQRVAFFSLRANEACNCYARTVFLYDTASGTVSTIANPGQPFARHMQDGSINGSFSGPNLRWSDNGLYLAFVANESGKPVLNVYDVATEETRALTANEDPIYGFVWAPDSKTIIYQTGHIQPEVRRRYDEGLKYGFLFDNQYQGASHTGLPLLPEVPVNLITDGTLFGSPRAAVSILKRVSMKNRVAPAKDNDEIIFENLGTSTFGPHDNVVFHGIGPEYREKIRISDQGTIIVSEANSDRRVTCDGFCDAKVNKVFIDPSSGVFTTVRIKEGRVFLTRFTLDKVLESHVEKVIAEFSLPANYYGSLRPICDAALDTVVCVVEEPNAPPFLAQIDANGKIENIFDPNQELRSRHYSRVEHFEISNTIGVSTFANLHYPAHYEAGRRYPLIVVQYRASGFARGGTGNENPILPYTEAGFFVLNYTQTGITSKEGTSLEKAVAQFHSRQPVNMHFLDALINYYSDAGLVDDDRIAYTGLSGGANLIDYLLANDVEMEAVIYSQCCHSSDLVFLNLHSLWSGTRDLLRHGNPLRDPNYRIKDQLVSPVPHVEKIEAAILANISEHETHNFKPLLGWMRELGKPMEVYVYADEHHIKTKPKHRAAIYRRNIDWLQFWLRGIENPNPVDPEQYERWHEMRDERCGKATDTIPSYCRENLYF